jgi:L-2-hydroxyglutarate oxidase LhgO
MPPPSAPDVVLIGGGIMSAHLGAMLKCLDPADHLMSSHLCR